VCSWSLSSPHENSSTPCTFANKFFYIPPLVSTSIITDFRLVCERKAYYFYMKGSGRPKKIRFFCTRDGNIKGTVSRDGFGF
jgi:hypothetical protein